MIKRFYIAISIASILTACSTTNPNDPYEPYNRVMFKINDKLDETVLEPTTRGYQKVVPKPVRAGVTNVFDNLRDVVSLGSNILRLDIEKAATDVSRIGINTVWGLGGLLPVADLADMPNNKNTLGDTFASWGWKNSNYFVMPLSGPSTLRDSLGGAITTVYSPQSALISNNKVLYGISGLNVVDTRAKYLGLTDVMKDAAPDKYAYMRDFYMARRASQTGGQYNTTNNEDDLSIDDLFDENDDNKSSESSDNNQSNTDNKEHQ